MTDEISNSLSEKKKSTVNELSFFVSQLGFDDLQHFDNYISLFEELSRKYDLDQLNEESRELLFKTLEEKKVSHIIANNLIEKAAKALQQNPGGWPAVCWKCVYDYMGCLNGRTDMVVHHRNNEVQVTIAYHDTNNNSVTYTTTVYHTVGRIINVSFPTSSYTPRQCRAGYNNCLDGCRFG